MEQVESPIDQNEEVNKLNAVEEEEEEDINSPQIIGPNATLASSASTADISQESGAINVVQHRIMDSISIWSLNIFRIK